MNHLQKISQFLYFQLSAIFLVLIYMHSSYPKVENQSFVYVFFTLLLIPVWEKIIWSVFPLRDTKKYYNKKFALWSLLLVIVLWALWLSAIINLPLILLWLVVFTWYFNIDGRVYFLWALGVFLYVMLSLILWNENLAEGLSIIAYYLLIAWVISGIIENLSFSKKSSHA